VDYSESVFDAIVSEFAGFADRLNIPDLTFVPISALHGENVVTRSSLMPWYDGPSLLHHLEHVHVSSDRNLVDVRFPVQYVIRPQSVRYPDFRGYAGRVASGVLKPGDEVVVLPSGFGTRIASIETAEGPVDEAYPPMSVTVRLEDELDVSRGDMICRPHNQPTVTQDVDAMVCWMDEASALRPGARLVLKHTTRTCRALVKDLQYRLDVNTLHRDLEASELVLNEVGRVRLRTVQPVFVDSYARNRATGGFVLVDEQTNKTVGAGMISQLD
jgi:bifunctional enzyme CysN/CysC